MYQDNTLHNLKGSRQYVSLWLKPWATQCIRCFWKRISMISIFCNKIPSTSQFTVRFHFLNLTVYIPPQISMTWQSVHPQIYNIYFESWIRSISNEEDPFPFYFTFHYFNFIKIRVVLQFHTHCNGLSYKQRGPIKEVKESS